MACCKRSFVQKTPLLCGVITPNQDGVSPNSNRKYQTCRSTQITGCCVLLQLKLGSHKHDMKAENVLGYYCNLDSLRYVTSTASCLKTLWENTLFLLTKALFNHAVNCTAIGLCSVLKTNQWLGSGAALAYGDRARQNGRSHLAI